MKERTVTRVRIGPRQRLAERDSLLPSPMSLEAVLPQSWDVLPAIAWSTHVGIVGTPAKGGKFRTSHSP